MLDWSDDPEVSIFSIDDGITFMRRQMADYADLPCDFADATLIYAAWRTRIREIWTLDSDFLVYLLPDRTRFKVIPGGKASAAAKSRGVKLFAPPAQQGSATIASNVPASVAWRTFSGKSQPRTWNAQRQLGVGSHAPAVE